MFDGEDHAALVAACQPGAALCTVVGIEGSFSRRLGAQLAILPDGGFAGDLADGCLERQLRSDCAGLDAPLLRRYGRGSDRIDFRLPCGGGLDILIDPAPDPSACARVLHDLRNRRATTLALPEASPLAELQLIPPLVVRIFGEGPEVAAVERIGKAAAVACDTVEASALALGSPSGLPPADRWTAVILLFHDHEWEVPLIEEALGSDAFYIGAQGGFPARSARIEALRRRGLPDDAIARLRSPIGLTAGSRSPNALALSILAEITGDYERLRSQA